MANRVDDARFRKNQKALFTALIKISNNNHYDFDVRPNTVYRLAKVSRSTFRRHYRKVSRIFEDEDEKLINRFAELNFKNLTFEQIWYKVLLFILKNREFFLMKINKGDDRLIVAMMRCLYGKTDFGWGNYDTITLDRILTMCTSEVFALLKIWADNELLIDQMNWYAVRFAQVVETADKRWGSLVK